MAHEIMIITKKCKMIRIWKHGVWRFLSHHEQSRNLQVNTVYGHYKQTQGPGEGKRPAHHCGFRKGCETFYGSSPRRTGYHGIHPGICSLGGLAATQFDIAALILNIVLFMAFPVVTPVAYFTTRRNNIIVTISEKSGETCLVNLTSYGVDAEKLEAKINSEWNQPGQEAA